MKNLKFRLIVMNFLQFGVWGAYLTCIGNYLGRAGMGDLIPWVYAIQGIVSIFMPTIMGIIADRWIQPQRVLGGCQLIAALFMLACFGLGYQANANGTDVSHSLFITLYTLSVAFYMPTIALSNTAAFAVLRNAGYDTIKAFPPIRVFGTVGFIAAMWFVNCASFNSEGGFFFTLNGEGTPFQNSYWQMFVSGFLGIILGLYCFTLPKCPLVKSDKKRTLLQTFGFDAFKLFKVKKMAIFFIFSMLLGMCLQVTNGYATPFLSSFKGSGFADSFVSNNATLLTSLSQISEALCILMIPFFLRRFGIKRVMLMAMVAWVLRFGLFGVGSPDFPGVILFILSMIVYGVAFDFFNVSGALYVERETRPEIQASAQGIFMLMTNGIGATVGTLSAGAVVDKFCQWTKASDGERYLLGDWTATWLIFAGFALAVTVAFLLIFKDSKKVNATAAEDTAKLEDSQAGGFVESELN
ncbi:MAG: nucleoside permease [Bacteroidales bacterium]|nr:nucleoside permease [Bacteroidales bacterium]MBD5258340.1 nucleoside permease [Barnesiella sp.]